MEFDRKGLKISERVDQSMSGIEVEHRFFQWGANLIQPPKQLQRFYIHIYIHRKEFYQFTYIYHCCDGDTCLVLGLHPWKVTFAVKRHSSV